MNKYSLVTLATVAAVISASALGPSFAQKNNGVDLSDPFKAGLHFMNNNDYVSAVGYFQKAVEGKYKESSIAHYYLANALWKRGRKDDALISYAKSYLFDPTGQPAKHAVRVLRHYSGRVKTIASKKELTPKVRKVVRAAGIDEASLEKASKKNRPASPSGSLIDKNQLQTVEKRMPKLTPFNPDQSNAKDFWKWHPRDQADFLPVAEARMEQAKIDLRATLQVFEKAKFEASRILPQNRNHGESAEEFKRRSKEQRDKYNEIMRPYRQDVADRTTFANDTISVRNRAWLMWGQERDIPYLAMPEEAKKASK